jgi:phosphoserine aminotransferase
MSRVFNFGAGPAVMPEEAILEAQQQLFDYKGCGMSIMEMSHRGKEYDAVHTEALDNLRKLMGVPDDYAVLLLQGGASGQFAMIPMNLLRAGGTADYVNSGAWASKAIKEAKIVGAVNVIANTGKDIPTRLPSPADLKYTPGAAYVHITSNETIAGTQWKSFPKTPAPLVADMSSDILSRPFDMKEFGLVYAGAQKNLGPSGLAVVVVRKDLMERCPETVPSFFRYKTHAEENSLYNTPPTFGIYMLMLTTRWLLKMGGVAGIARQNQAKAATLYAAIDGSGGYYRGTAVPEFRSDMNVTWRLPDEAREEKFIKEASAKGMKGLKGHRSVGGIRASIYNAFPPAGLDALAAFMKEFQAANG